MTAFSAGGARCERGVLTQCRFPSAALKASFERALSVSRRMKEYQEKVEYIHFDPVKADSVASKDSKRRAAPQALRSFDLVIAA